MTDRLREKHQSLDWLEGSDVGEFRPLTLMTARKLFENQNGDQLALTLVGTEGSIAQYLDSFSLAFQVTQLSERDATAILDELENPEPGSDDYDYIAPDEIGIYFEILERQPPYRWEVYIDPTANRDNVEIAGSEIKHKYRTTKTNWVQTTIEQEGGALNMKSGWQEVFVNDAVKVRAIVRGASGKGKRFLFRVDGLDGDNMYDLSVVGAMLT